MTATRTLAAALAIAALAAPTASACGSSMSRARRIHHRAKAARNSSVIATTSTPLLAPHARATRQIAHARERSDPSSGETKPPAARSINPPIHPHPSPRSTP